MKYNLQQHANPYSFELLLKRSGSTRRICEQLFHDSCTLAKMLLDTELIDNPRKPKTYQLNFAFNAIYRDRPVVELRLEVVDNGLNTPTLKFHPRYEDYYYFETESLPDGPLVHKAIQYLLESIGKDEQN